MKKKLVSIVLIALMLVSALAALASCTGAQTPASPQKLTAPTVTLTGNTASWAADPTADKFEISLDGNLSYVENTITSKKLSDGETLKVRAVGDGVNYSTSDWSNSVTFASGSSTPEPTKLATPILTLSNTGLASWSAVANSAGYVYKIGGVETPTSATSVQLALGQSISVKAVGDGINYTDSDYSAARTYTASTPTPTDAPTYLGIFASSREPSLADGVPDAFASSPRTSYRTLSQVSYRDFSSALDEYFENDSNHLGTSFPPASDYEIYSRAGDTVYIQIWLDNPEQYTILSLKLNGNKYQVGGDLSSFFVEEGGKHYNCIYVAVTIPSTSHTEKSYTVTDIEYISNTYINADGTDEFMNDNDTVRIGLPYGEETPTVTGYAEELVGIDSYIASFTLDDSEGLASVSGGWLGLSVYDGYNIVFNKALSKGGCQIEAASLVENTAYTVIVYLYADLHDGRGVRAHEIRSFDFTTLSAVEYFEAEPGYYQHWEAPELDMEVDSGLSIDVSFYLASETAHCDRLEILKGEELVYVNSDFSFYTTVEDLLANTTYTVRVYFSDSTYSEHYVEKELTTGELDVPEMTLKEKYGFLNSATFTFDYIQNGFLRSAITKNIKVRIYQDLWQLEHIDYVLMLCDDPTLVDRVQEQFDQAIADGDWGLASKIDHEILTYLNFARDIINEGELGDFGYDRAAWEEYLETVSRTFYLDTEDFFGNSDTGNAYLIFRDYAAMFTNYGNSRYKITADVNMKDGNGFVEKCIGSGSIDNVIPINSEHNRIGFDCEIDGLNVTVNPYFNVDRTDMNLLIISYEIGLYTTSGKLVDTLYTSEEVNWSDFDEEAWINAYVCAMKGEAILPSREQIIEQFGWRAIFEILRSLDFGFEEDYIGGDSSGDIIVDGTGSVIRGGGKREKNIANQRERQILRELLAYDYPDWYEYDLKTSMLESFMYDDYYYELVDGLESIDAKLEALISGALNSTISRVLGDCESGIQHFLTWFGSEEDEIYVGFKSIIESYIEDTGKEPDVNWEESYRRIMMFEDFYTFYPFGYTKELEIKIDEEKYSSGTYLIGISYRYDSYEPGAYETQYYYNTEVEIP